MEIFNSLFESSTQNTLSVGIFLLCVLFSLIDGIIVCLAYLVKNETTKSFKLSLMILPTIVCVVIMMVNGNIGVGVAVAGAFSLVRFRSAPGSAKEICVIFAGMCAGLIAGVGYIAYSLLFSILIGLLIIVLNILLQISDKKNTSIVLKITIPEDLEYNEVFTDLFKDYTKGYSLISVKTTNMGSLYKLKYKVKLNNVNEEKEFIDKIRMRNGNLEVAILKTEFSENDL